MITYYHEKPIVSDEDIETTERDQDFPLFEVQCDCCLEGFEIIHALDDNVERIKEKIKRKGWVVCNAGKIFLQKEYDTCYHKECYDAVHRDMTTGD